MMIPFDFPVSPDIFDKSLAQHRSRKFVVVSIIGNSGFDGRKLQLIKVLSHKKIKTVPTSRISGYIDLEESVIYLHLLSHHDALTFPKLNKNQGSECEDLFVGDEAEYLRALLVLFSISHIIVFVQEGSCLSISTVQTLKTLHQIREKVLPSLCDLLLNFPISRDFALNARPCPPRCLFYFPSFEVSTFLAHQQPKQKDPFKRLQHSIEDHIYQTFRKCYVITNNSNYGILSIPANQEFVFIEKPNRQTPELFLLNQLDSACDSISAEKAVVEHSIRRFLNVHVRTAFMSGFNDQIGRHSQPSPFEIPSLSVWHEICRCLSDFLLTRHSASEESWQFVADLLNANIQFSENRCSKLVALAESVYLDGLPSYYPSALHREKLAAAQRFYDQQARGPQVALYQKKLREICQRIWVSRRQCEAISMTGHHCKFEYHRVPAQLPEEGLDVKIAEILQEVSHNSGFLFKAACNCGHSQVDRQDPFSHKSANFDFYRDLCFGCCDRFESRQLPLFSCDGAAGRPSIDQVAAGGLTQPLARTDLLEKMSGMNIASLGTGGDLSGNDQNQGVPGSHQHESSASLQHSPMLASVETALEEVVELVDSAEKESQADNCNSKEATSVIPIKPKEELPLHSVTEYLSVMLNSESSPLLLPLFSSWSILRLGDFNAYSPQEGMQQPGFLPYCNFLLPWEIYLRNTMEEKWPTVHNVKQGKVKTKTSVRCYLGLEYECSRGHRFFLSSPDRVFKVPQSGSFKENAHKILHNDMPLFASCPCRQTKSLISQLLRVFIAVPEPPAQAKLCIQVRPAPPPCALFFPSSSPIYLNSGFWVVRFPYMYVGEQGHLRRPIDVDMLAQCIMMKGSILMTST